MRFADKVEFIKEGETVYDRLTGSSKATESTSEVRLALVNQMSDEYASFAYGDQGISKRGLTVRVKQAPSKPFDYIKIIGGKFRDNNVLYKDIDSKMFRGKRSFQLEEVR